MEAAVVVVPQRGEILQGLVQNEEERFVQAAMEALHLPNLSRQLVSPSHAFESTHIAHGALICSLKRTLAGAAAAADDLFVSDNVTSWTPQTL